MITEEQMKQLFAQANPIPESESVELGEVRGATYLAALKQRSSEVTKTDTTPQTDKEQRRPTGKWLVARGAGCHCRSRSWFLINQDEQEPGPIDQPTSTTVVETTSTSTQPETALGRARRNGSRRSLS